MLMRGSGAEEALRRSGVAIGNDLHPLARQAFSKTKIQHELGETSWFFSTASKSLRSDRIHYISL